MSAYEIVWNGTKDRGPYLFAEAHPIRTEQPPPDRQPREVVAHRHGSFQGRRTGTFERVRQQVASFNGAWFSSAEMAYRARVSSKQAAVALFAMCAHGRLEKAGTLGSRRYRRIAG